MAKQLNVNYRDRLQSAQNLGDSLFQNFSSSQTDESSVIEIELSKLHEFKNHPFKVTDDDKMQELAESIKQNGVLVPAIVRKCDNGEYELISGHRRKHACELAGLTTMPAVIKDYSNDAATIIMVDSNLQREVLLPSEKAKSYAMKYEAMKHQGVQGSGRSIEILGSLSNEGKSTVQRYIWLASGRYISTLTTTTARITLSSPATLKQNSPRSRGLFCCPSELTRASQSDFKPQIPLHPTIHLKNTSSGLL